MLRQSLKPRKLFDGLGINNIAETTFSRLREEGVLTAISRRSQEKIGLNETFQSTWESKIRRQGNLIVHKSIGKYPTLYRADSSSAINSLKWSEALKQNTLETIKSRSLNKSKLRDQFLNITTSPPDTFIDVRTNLVDKIITEHSESPRRLHPNVPI